MSEIPWYIAVPAILGALILGPSLMAVINRNRR